jgi:hypothetical protein
MDKTRIQTGCDSGGQAILSGLDGATPLGSKCFKYPNSLFLIWVVSLVLRQGAFFLLSNVMSKLNPIQTSFILGAPSDGTLEAIFCLLGFESNILLDHNNLLRTNAPCCFLGF